MKPSNESSDVLHLQGSSALECSTLLLSGILGEYFETIFPQNTTPLNPFVSNVLNKSQMSKADVLPRGNTKV